MISPIHYAFEGNQIRALMIEGEPWFVAADVCASLAIGNTSLAVNGRADRDSDGLDTDERGIASVNTPSGDQEMLVVNESGLYSLIFKSRKAIAKHFKRWVTHEVLPSLRKHGSFVMPTGEPSIEVAEAPIAAHIEAEQIVSAGRAFRALFTTARSMGMPRRLASTRANQATERATGVDLAAELGASGWLDNRDLPDPHRKHYELQQQLRDHLSTNNWPEGITTQQIIESLGLTVDKGTQMAVGQCLQLLGYSRVRLAASRPGGVRPNGYVLKRHGLQLEAAA